MLQILGIYTFSKVKTKKQAFSSESIVEFSSSGVLSRIEVVIQPLNTTRLALHNFTINFGPFIYVGVLL